jgi:hypothetical protein
VCIAEMASRKTIRNTAMPKGRFSISIAHLRSTTMHPRGHPLAWCSRAAQLRLYIYGGEGRGSLHDHHKTPTVEPESTSRVNGEAECPNLVNCDWPRQSWHPLVKCQVRKIKSPSGWWMKTFHLLTGSKLGSD